ncbi:hypothetical protein Acr_26g0012360 [Actinidia rufa]|uniref:Uncharacterized protein n=1 Tax=Actinidia rufa TaxID=165716 RepID=A0A7J0H4F1_9ERIC|nr:hypothetical protein Acr_26g0012360 [Actinidia rufa]
MFYTMKWCIRAGEIAQISGQWHTISRQWAAMAHICPGHGSDFSAMGSHGSNFWAMAHNFLGNGQPWLKFLGNGLTISRQWAAMAHNCPAMAQISGQWHTIFSAMGSHGSNFWATPHKGNGQPWHTIARPWLKFLAMAHNFSAMGSHGTFARPWLRFLAMGSHGSNFCLISSVHFLFRGVAVALTL